MSTSNKINTISILCLYNFCILRRYFKKMLTIYYCFLRFRIKKCKIHWSSFPHKLNSISSATKAFFNLLLYLFLTVTAEQVLCITNVIPTPKYFTKCLALVFQIALSCCCYSCLLVWLLAVSPHGLIGKVISVTWFSCLPYASYAHMFTVSLSVGNNKNFKSFKSANLYTSYVLERTYTWSNLL